MSVCFPELNLILFLPFNKEKMALGIGANLFYGAPDKAFRWWVDILSAPLKTQQRHSYISGTELTVLLWPQNNPASPWGSHGCQGARAGFEPRPSARKVPASSRRGGATYGPSQPPISSFQGLF